LYFFRALFYGGMKESKETEVELKETPVAAFMRILPFIYIYLSIRIFDEPYFLDSFYHLAYINMNIRSIYSESLFSIAFKISSIFVSTTMFLRIGNFWRLFESIRTAWAFSTRPASCIWTQWSLFSRHGGRKIVQVDFATIWIFWLRLSMKPCSARFKLTLE